MLSTAIQAQNATHGLKGPSLSVVVVSTGSLAAARRAANALKSASVGLKAQLIVVSQADDPHFASSVEPGGAEFVYAPAGCSRAEMCDLGMKRVNGSIVVVRDDVAVGDGGWLNNYRSVMRVRDVAAAEPRESVVLDTLKADWSVPADRAAFASHEA